jgi:hypothetical protein
MANIDTASLTIAELREFAGFSNAEQRYIKRSLDIGLGRQDAFKLWARTPDETAAIRSQYVLYQELKALRGEMPEGGGFDGIEQFMGTLIRLTAFDLAQERIDGFSAYRFLYERLLGAEVRPWLPRCPRSAPNAAAACSSRSAKPPPPRPAGAHGRRRSIPSGWRRRRHEGGKNARAIAVALPIDCARPFDLNSRCDTLPS